MDSRPPAPVVVVRQRLHAAGISRFEFAVVVIVFGLVMMVLLERLALVRKEGDRAGMEALLVNLRSALYGKVVALQAQGRDGDIGALAGANPMQWLQSRPQNYLGELDQKAAELATAGQWYFDVKQHKLVYVLESKKSSSSGATERICFRVESGRLPSKNANAERATPAQAGVALTQVAE